MQVVICRRNAGIMVSRSYKTHIEIDSSNIFTS